jgi:hypothetical protein
MVSRYGSDATFAGNADGGVIDNQGNPIISTGIGPGASPLGYAVLNQIVGKFPNGLINFPPQDISTAIGNFDNPLPFWNVTDESDGRINAKFVILDSAISSALSSAISASNVGGSGGGSYVGLGGLKITPTNALSGDTFTLSQRAPTVVIPKLKEIGWAVYGYTGPGTPTSAFYVTTDVIYYDGEGAAISTATLGSTTNFSIAVSNGKVHTGYTQGTSSTDYVSDSATEVEMISTLVVTAGTVTEDQSIYISSMVVSPEFGASGSATPEGRVYRTYSSSSTWVVPTGVQTIDVVAIGAGGGGASGALSRLINSGNTAGTGLGGPPGGASGYGFARDVGVLPGGTVTITLGSGGAGGAANTYVKPVGTASTDGTAAPAVGGAGGASSISITHGTMISITGGGGGGTAAVGAPGVVTVNSPAGVTVAAGTAATSATTIPSSPASSSTNLFTPYIQPSDWYAAAAGEDAYAGATNTSPVVLALGGSAYADKGFSSGGAWGGSAVSTTATSSTAITAQAGGVGRYGSGGGGGASGVRISGTVNTDATFFSGAGADSNGYGSGGSGGGGLRMNAGSLNSSERAAYDIYIESGAGGEGSNALAIISYVTPGSAI